MLKLKPIPTTYRGIKYRSRLEARWAVFFHELGWIAEYEPNGFVVGFTPYLPDFLIRDYDGHGPTFIEVKPTGPSQGERIKMGGLVRASKIPGLIVIGSPIADSFCRIRFDGNEESRILDDAMPQAWRAASCSALTERFDDRTKSSTANRHEQERAIRKVYGP